MGKPKVFVRSQFLQFRIFSPSLQNSLQRWPPKWPSKWQKNFVRIKITVVPAKYVLWLQEDRIAGASRTFCLIWASSLQIRICRDLCKIEETGNSGWFSFKIENSATAIFLQLILGIRKLNSAGIFMKFLEHIFPLSRTCPVESIFCRDLWKPIDTLKGQIYICNAI